MPGLQLGVVQRRGVVHRRQEIDQLAPRRSHRAERQHAAQHAPEIARSLQQRRAGPSDREGRLDSK